MSVTDGEPKCPMCGGKLDHDEVDIGVGSLLYVRQPRRAGSRGINNGETHVSAR